MTLWYVRGSGALAAIVWLAGVPAVGMSAMIGPTAATFVLTGVVFLVTGVAALVLTVSAPPAGVRFARACKAYGFAMGTVLTVASFLLVLSAVGALGNQAPDWVATGQGSAVYAFYLWLVLVSLVWRRTFGWAAVGLGVLACASPLLSTFWYHVSTNATAIVDFALFGVSWLSPVVWWLVVAWRVPAQGRTPAAPIPQASESV